MALEETKNGTATSDSNKLMDKTKMAVGNGASDIINIDQIKKVKDPQIQKSDPNTEFLRAARAGDLERINEFLECGEVTDINTCNQNGLNALHLASKDGHVEVVRELLNRGASVNNATKKKNTALHIASLAGQKEVIKLLLQKNADVNVRSLNGFTPLYMAAQENHDTCVRYLLAKGANQGLTTDDGFTPLAVAMQQGHEKVVAVLLENDSRSKVRLPALHIAAKKDDIKAATLLLENEHNPDIASKSGFTPLHIAAHYGNIKIASLLIEKGADVNFQAKHNITPLHVACKWGKVNMVEILISKGAKIDTTTRDGLTPLHCAARNGNEDVINILLSNNANILSKTKNGLTPLHMAAQGEHVDAARNLLNHKAPVDEVTGDYLTALHVASHCGHVKVAKLLLDREADPNARALNGFTPLHIACKKNRIKVVELLLKHGASISATTESGLTPLHVASFMGCMNIVIYLLQCDASPDIPTVRGETPLHLAARANQTDVVRILLRNGAQVDTKAREEQTPLHVASRLGNIDIVMLLLQHGANIDSSTKDQYTSLHIAAKEGQEEIAAALIENGASLDAATKKGFTPLHSAAKYGNIKVVKLLLQKGAKIDAQGKNGVTPLHVASHYNHEDVALLLLENGASPHSSAKNGHTPLHIAAKKNQMEIATKLLEYGAKQNAESKSGFTPLHLSTQEGHTDMIALLLEHKADPNHPAKNGLTPLHLCAQEDCVGSAKLLVDNGCKIDPETKAGYTPLHIAAHFGQVNMVKFLLENDANIEMSTNIGYRPLHQAAQQGHTLIINLLLKHKADPNATTNNGQTALSIADKLGYITVVETLKVVTETSVTNAVPNIVDEKYKVVAPEAMHETFISDSEDEGGEDPTVYDNFNYNYMMDDIKNISDEQNHMKDDAFADERDHHQTSIDGINEIIVHQVKSQRYNTENNPLIITALDNVEIARNPIHVGLHVLNTLKPCLESFGGRKIISPMCRESFLVSFLVDARGGAMRGCRHSGVRVIVPPQSAAQPTRITCRYVKPQKTPNPPPLMEGEALVSRILELGPIGANFLGPVILEVPHFASLREKEREIVILRSDNGQTWREHTLADSEEAIQHVLNNSFEGDELYQIEDLHTNRITRIVTNDFPHFFAVISRIRQEVHAIGPEGGTVSSIAVPQVQAVFPANALTKRIKVGLQAQPIDSNKTAELVGRGVAVSPVVTVEPRRRKFHKAITLSMPAPKAHTQGMINQYSGSENAPTLRLLCSITGGQNRAVWEDVTGSTPLTFVKDCVSFTTTVSARFWLMDCINISEASKMASELYSYNAHVPFMVKFVVFAKRIDPNEAKLSVFCMTDDKEDKTLEQQEHFVEIAKSRDVEVLEGRTIYLEFAGNLVPVLKSGDQLNMEFNAFKENRLAFTIRTKDLDDSIGRILFMNDPKVAKGEAAQIPICTLNISLPEKMVDDEISSEQDVRSLEKNYRVFFDKNLYSSKNNEIQRGDIRLSDICNLLGPDWEKLAKELEVDDTDIELIKSEYPNKESQQAMIMLRLWLRRSGKQATGNNLEQALHRIKRSDIVDKCIFNLELVTDEMEKAVAKMQLDQSGFDNLKEELGPSRETSLHRNTKIDPSYCSDISDKLESSKINGHTLINDSHEDFNNAYNTQQLNSELEKLRDKPSIVGVTTRVESLSQTPPSSPAEVELQKSGILNGELHIESDFKVPPTAEPDDFQHQQSLLSQSEAVLETLNKSIADTDTYDLEDESQDEEDIQMKNETKIDTIKSQTKIPVAAKTSTPIKIKTIKKHSKVNVELKKQPPTTRPAVGDIDWDIKSDVDLSHSSSSSPPPPERQTPNDNSLPDNNEISSLALEDVTSKTSTSSDPTIVVSSDETGDDELPNTEIILSSNKRFENEERVVNRDAHDIQELQDDPSLINPDQIIQEIYDIPKLVSEQVIGKHFNEVTNNKTAQCKKAPPIILIRQEPEMFEAIPISQESKSVVTKTIREIGPDGTENVIVTTETHWPNGETTFDIQKSMSDSPAKSDITGRATSESDSENLQQTNKMIPNNKSRTMESSSGSDVALHEPGTELSDDETETDFYHNNEHPVTYSETITTEVVSPDSKESITRTTVTTTTAQLTSEQIPSDMIQDIGNNDTDKRESLQKMMNTFMNEERKNF